MNKIASDLYQKHLNHYLQNLSDGLLKEAIVYILENPGKLLRSNLFYSTLNFLGLDSNDFASVGFGIELIHTYSLIHDDLPAMDDDDYRRNRLTLHKKYDEATAILSGDALLSDAFKILIDFSGDSRIKVKLVTELSNAIGSNGMVLGQMYDVSGNSAKRDKTDLLTIHKFKTGKLISFSIYAACIIADIEIEIYKLLGEKIGILFQIKDDIDDFSVNAKEEAKNIFAEINKEKLINMKNALTNEVYQLMQKIGLKNNDALYEMIKKIISE